MKSHDEVQYEGNDSFSLERRSSWYSNRLYHSLRNIMKGIRAFRMKQIRSYFLISLIGLLSLFAHPALSESRTVGLVRATCNSTEAIMELAKADEKSVYRAGEIYTAFMKAGMCGALPAPMMMEFETKLHHYKDSKGVETDVWKIKNLKHWVIVATSYVRKVPLEEKKKEETTDIRV